MLLPPAPIPAVSSPGGGALGGSVPPEPTACTPQRAVGGEAGPVRVVWVLEIKLLNPRCASLLRGLQKGPKGAEKGPGEG